MLNSPSKTIFFIKILTPYSKMYGVIVLIGSGVYPVYIRILKIFLETIIQNIDCKLNLQNNIFV